MNVYDKKKYTGLTHFDRFEFDGDGVYLSCEFTSNDFGNSDIKGIFLECKFIHTDLYGCFGHKATFYNCKFIKCDLRASLYDVLFFECEFKDCDTGKNNMGRTLRWPGSVAVNCDMIRTIFPITAEYGNKSEDKISTEDGQ